MQLQLQTFTGLVSMAAAVVQGAARQLVDLTVGSTLRALLEASASIGLWMQWLILQVLQMTRAATSVGADLDSWVADFGLRRLPGVAACGTVTLSRFVPSSTALVTAGAGVRTGDGSQAFLIVADASNPAWSAAQNGFVLRLGETAVTVTVAAMVAGVAGNVQASTISLIATALPGIDTVTNTAPLQGGLDAESDPALRARFQNFINSRSRATLGAVGYAITSVQQELQYTVAENQQPDGTSQLGVFTVTVDDGSGAPGGALYQNVAAAIEAVRPVGSIFTVRGPTVVQAQITLAVDTADSVTAPTVRANVAASLAAYVNALPIGAHLTWSRLVQVAYATSSEITNVRGVLLNGGVGDIDPGASGVVKTSGVTVS